MSYECCRNCKPPKRHTEPDNCHDHCREYIEEAERQKEINEKMKLDAYVTDRYVWDMQR